MVLYTRKGVTRNQCKVKKKVQCKEKVDKDGKPTGKFILPDSEKIRLHVNNQYQRLKKKFKESKNSSSIK